MKTANDAPFAIASDGSVLLNVTAFEGDAATDILVARALREEGDIFIGVRLRRDEVERVLGMGASGYREAAAFIAGARMWAKGAHT